MSNWVLKNLDYQYMQSEITTFTGIQGSFQTGKSYQILGASGSGKSTLLALLAGVTVCSRGSLTFDGQELALLNRDAYRGSEVACLFQESCLLKDSPLGNLELEVFLSGAHSNKEVLKQTLFSVGLMEKQLKLPVEKLAKKDRQLVALAKLLVKPQAKLILVDEPEKLFSECGVSYALKKLRSYCLQQKKCLIFTTQTLRSVKFADELWGLNGGKLLFIKGDTPK